MHLYVVAIRLLTVTLVLAEMLDTLLPLTMHVDTTRDITIIRKDEGEEEESNTTLTVLQVITLTVLQVITIMTPVDMDIPTLDVDMAIIIQLHIMDLVIS